MPRIENIIINSFGHDILKGSEEDGLPLMWSFSAVGTLNRNMQTRKHKTCFSIKIFVFPFFVDEGSRRLQYCFCTMYGK
jgi:hypothetical protein